MSKHEATMQFCMVLFMSKLQGLWLPENDFTISTIANYLPVRGFVPAVAKNAIL
jgi:hypothetical protein